MNIMSITKYLSLKPNTKSNTMDIEQITSTFNNYASIKGALSGLRQFLATKSPLKMMKTAFYFTSFCSQDI